jgi:hypothetical protein
MYVMSGHSMGRIRRVRDWATDYPKAFVAIGYWGAGATRADQTEVRKIVDPNWWLPTGFKDHALIFTPDGSVASNDLALVDQSYKLLVCGAVDYSAGGLTGPKVMTSPVPSYLFRRAASPYTISIQLDGTISMDSGAPGLAIEASPFAMAADPAPARSAAPFVAAIPVVDNVVVSPPPVLDTVATVVQGGSLSVLVQASDPSGDDLFIEWSASPLTRTETGAFSASGKQPMTWSQVDRKWNGRVTWTPPLDAAVGDRFDLSYSVTNSAGRAATTSTALLEDVTVRKDETIFLSDDNGIFSIQSNGTGMRQVVAAREPWYVSVSPDGSRIAWDQSAYDRDALYVANLDGSAAKFVYSAPSQYYLTSQWNPSGTRLYFTASSSGIRTVKPDGTGVADLLPRAPGLSAVLSFDITSNGKYIIANIGARRDAANPYVRDLWIAELDESVSPPRVKDWTNLTVAHAVSRYNHPCGDSNIFMTIAPTADPSQPLVIYRGAYDSVRTALITDLGPGNSPRFTAAFGYLGTKMWDIAFSPEGDRAVIAEDGFGGASVGDWSSTPPTISNLKKIGTQSFRMVDWR